LCWPSRRRLHRKRDELARRQDALPEELVTETVLEYFLLADPETKTALHLNLSDQYLKSAGHRVTDGEGGCREKERGAQKSHRSNRFVAELRSEANEPEIQRLWQIATSLHQNFSEVWLPAEMVGESQ
jgi:hypothetical protein